MKAFAPTAVMYRLGSTIAFQLLFKPLKQGVERCVSMGLKLHVVSGVTQNFIPSISSLFTRDASLRVSAGRKS